MPFFKVKVALIIIIIIRVKHLIYNKVQLDQFSNLMEVESEAQVTTLLNFLSTQIA